MPKCKQNRYRDIEIDVSYLTFADQAGFTDVIQKEHDKWYSKLKYPQIRDTAVMWINVPKEFARVVPWLLAMSPPFILHHANTQRIMLVRPANPAVGRRTQIPSYGTHYVKVDCVVVEENTGRILMVREKLGTDIMFKLVTGSAEAGEFFGTAAEREVWEEAGVRCRAVSVVGCGNRIRTRFDRDEIIMGVLLFAPQGQYPRPDGFEVREAMWCSIAEATEHCTTISREWIAAASAARGIDMPRMSAADLFRGPPHTMDLYIHKV